MFSFPSFEHSCVSNDFRLDNFSVSATLIYIGQTSTVCDYIFVVGMCEYYRMGPPLWSSVQSSWLHNGDVL
jgi:hypothetical protein